MRVRVKLFAAARELAGAGEVTLEVPDGATVADVERRCCSECPGIGEDCCRTRAGPWMPSLLAGRVDRDRECRSRADSAGEWWITTLCRLSP